MKPSRDQVLKELKEIKSEMAQLRKCAVRPILLKPVKFKLEKMAEEICVQHNIDWDDFLNINLAE